MFIVAETKGSQHKLKGQCALVPTDLNKIQIILSWSCDEEYLISFALKHLLTGKSEVNRPQICPSLVNTALQKLTKINSFYSNIINNEWKYLSEQSYLVLWKLLTDKNARESNNSDQTDGDDNIDQEKVKFLFLVPNGEVLAFPKDYST